MHSSTGNLDQDTTKSTNIINLTFTLPDTSLDKVSDSDNITHNNTTLLIIILLHSL